MSFSTLFQETNDVSAKIQKCLQELSSYLKTYPLFQELNNLDTLETSVLENESKHIDELEERVGKLEKDIKQTEKALKKTKNMLDEEEQSIREGKPRPLWKCSTIASHLPGK
ncbi:hypothetical protein MERGE_001268 [Pneumocystis wakefieldiae]|uniref:Uncharacterized protein n=1 Tax=Pneumocystis wakefieldiae TaxID=38082 RepID=A0A899FYK0_9ASCO|nr:hypothetical protein MERGE_001268 [Pneumocystis wakefieldiae]